VRRLPAGPGPLGSPGHQVRGEADDALIDEDDPERRQALVQADLEAGMVRAKAVQHAERLRIALAPSQLAEPLVSLGLRIDQQEPDGPALVIKPA
jgi:hypothetical protein